MGTQKKRFVVSSGAWRKRFDPSPFKGLRRRRESLSSKEPHRRIMAPLEEGRRSTGISGATVRSVERMKALTSAAGTGGSMKANSSRSVSSGRPGDTHASADRARPSCQSKLELELSRSLLAYSSPELWSASIASIDRTAQEQRDAVLACRRTVIGQRRGRQGRAGRQWRG